MYRHWGAPALPVRSSCTCPPLNAVVTGTGDYYIVSGQHTYVASQQLRHKYQTDNRPIPSWMKTFRVQILKDGLSTATIVKVAGKLQGAALSVKALSLSQTMDKFLQKVHAAQAAGQPEGAAYRTELLRKTYDDSGKSSVVDGTRV